jgi:hypothetical protein
MAHENPSWGEERIANELLLKLGPCVSPRTVRKYLPELPAAPRSDQRWSTFLKNHAQAIVACDFCVVAPATFQILYVFVVMEHVGIDVAKAALDVFMGSAGTAFTVSNDEVGIRDLVRQLASADFAILEATGGLETPVASALAAAGIAVAIVNPHQVRDFARATGRLAKTDRLDAEVLAQVR